jgi:hypothetical protein
MNSMLLRMYGGGKDSTQKHRSLVGSVPRYDPGHNMGLGTKNRQKQTADICKQHLREKYGDKLGLVEEFIVEFEGARKDSDFTREQAAQQITRTLGPGFPKKALQNVRFRVVASIASKSG